jgi:hypothetical protein
MYTGGTIKLGSQSTFSNTSPRLQSSGSNDSLASPPYEFMDEDSKRQWKENQAAKRKDSSENSEIKTRIDDTKLVKHKCY